MHHAVDQVAAYFGDRVGVYVHEAVVIPIPLVENDHRILHLGADNIAGSSAGQIIVCTAAASGKRILAVPGIEVHQHQILIAFRIVPARKHVGAVVFRKFQRVLTDVHQIVQAVAADDLAVGEIAEVIISVLLDVAEDVAALILHVALLIIISR